MVTRLILSLLLLVLPITACSGGGTGPRAVAERWLHASSTEDTETARSLVVPEGRILYDLGLEQAGSGYFSEIVLGEAVVDSNEATVTAEGHAFVQLITLERRDGVWLIAGYGEDPDRAEEVDGMKSTAGRTFLETDDYIDPIVAATLRKKPELGLPRTAAQERPEARRAQSERQAEALKQAKISPPETLARHWQNGESFTGQTAEAAIEALAQSVGLRVDAGAHVQQLQQTLNVDLSELTVLEAINRAAEAVGLIVHFPIRATVTDLYFPAFRYGLVSDGQPLRDFVARADMALTFSAGERTHPLSFGGPLVMGIQALEEYPPYGTGKLTIGVLTFGLPPAMELANRAYTEHSLRREDILVRAETGISLVNPKQIFDGIMRMSAPLEIGARSYSGSVNLTALRQDVDHIGTIAVPVSLAIPQDIKSVHLSSVEKGARAQDGNLTVEIITADEDKTNIAVSAPGLNLRSGEATASVMVAGMTEAAEPAYIRFLNAWSSDPDMGTVNVSHDERLAELTLYLAHDFLYETYDLTLRDIPLMASDEKPPADWELTYEGYEEPVSWEVDSVSWHEAKNGKRVGNATLRLTNHTNKPLQAAYYTLFCRYKEPVPEKGYSIPSADVSSVFSYNREMEGGLPKMVAAPGETVLIELEIGETEVRETEVEVDIYGLHFVDGSVWKQ